MSDERSTEWAVTPIGVVRSGRNEAIDDDWDAVESAIELVAPYAAGAIQGLDAFSHVEVLFVFDRADPDALTTGTRHPRGNPDWPAVGIFAQRAKDRPNHVGLCTCEILAVEGSTVRVRGLDAIDGTPVIDLKPYMAEFAPRGTVRQPAWSHELMDGYWST
ncbi:MAG TPA: tRNA (N6-threonylcarbamoyladenosine(37)-N6)-methyltransferase TrmO [Acidimicrobiales bacterium]